MDPPDLLTNSLSQTAGLVHAQLQRSDSEYFKNLMAWIASQPDPRQVQPAVCFPSEFGVTQWNKLRPYAVEFEAGVRPARITLPHMIGFDGLIILLGTDSDASCAPTDEGSAEADIDAYIGLSEPAMKNLEAMPEFQEYI